MAASSSEGGKGGGGSGGGSGGVGGGVFSSITSLFGATSTSDKLSGKGGKGSKGDRGGRGDERRASESGVEARTDSSSDCSSSDTPRVRQAPPKKSFWARGQSRQSRTQSDKEAAAARLQRERRKLA